MREQRTIVDGVEFEKIFRAQLIFNSIRSSMHPSRLIIGFCMVLVLLASGRLWDSISQDDAMLLYGTKTIEAVSQARAVAIAQSSTALGQTAPEASRQWTVQEAQAHLIESWHDFQFEGNVTEKDRDEFQQVYLALEQVKPRGPFESSARYVANEWNSIVNGALELNPVQMWHSIVLIVWELPQLLWKAGFHWFISLYGFLLVYVLCIGGGAIARMQAVEHSRAIRMSKSAALEFSFSRWRSTLSALFSPALFVAVLTVLLMIIGLIFLNIPWLNLIGGLLYGAALLFGLFIALAAVGFATSFLLFIPAVVVEDCTGGEAVQRSFSYVVSKTIHFLGYAIALIVAMVIGFVIVRLITNLALDITADLVGSWTFNLSLHGAGSMQELAIPPAGMTWYETVAAWLISLWETILHDVMIGWVLSGFFSASTMVYLLMRSACDGNDTRDIWWPGLIQGTNIPSED